MGSRVPSAIASRKVSSTDQEASHLGGDFERDKGGTLSWGSTTWVKRMLKNCEEMFGEPPKEWLVLKELV